MKVLVPHTEGADVLSRLPGVEPVLYDASGPWPADAEVLIPAFLAGTDATEVLAGLPSLRLVQLLSAGAEAWIGRLPAGVALSDCRGAHGGATGEWVVSVLLAVYRHLPRFIGAQAEGRWDYHQTEELAGKRVLLVGAGDVAEETARRLAPFDVTVTRVGRTARPGVHGVDELRALLPDCDACVVVVPLTDSTRGLVDRDFLAALPDGSVLVNGARGPVVDTAALLAELQSGRLRAAADVTEPEPLPEGHALYTAPGFLLTPHVGGSVPMAMQRAYRVAAEQIAAFARGEEPPNLVVGDY
ncbi:MAG: phosphoglycerate dehydrogenase [Frankiales bacterium]|nr:phosphoglycerate dehydrogenase [Frankiales bacterium]